MTDMTKDQLLDRIERAHAAFEAALAGLSEAHMAEPGVQDDWSIKDILAHITFWHRRLSYLVGTAQRGEPFTSLRGPDEDGQAAVNRANAENYAANQHRPLDELRAEYAQAYDQALASVAALTNADLQAGSQISAALGGSVVELIAGDTYEHYQEHLPPIQAWRKKF